jgi:hypothetical protein
VSAAVPEEHHEACCIKHHTLRLQAEAEGNPYSKFDSSMFEDIACAEEGASSILQVRAKCQTHQACLLQLLLVCSLAANSQRAYLCTTHGALIGVDCQDGFVDWLCLSCGCMMRFAAG